MKIYHTSSHTSSLSNDITLIDRKRKVSKYIDAAHFLIDGKENAIVNRFTLKSKKLRGHSLLNFKHFIMFRRGRGFKICCTNDGSSLYQPCPQGFFSII